MTAAPQLPLPTIDPALQGHYEGLEDPAVVGYLLGHPRLQRLLIAAVPQVERVFGAEARVVLSTEAEYSGALTLYATVLDDPNLSTEAQIARLDRFDNEWWLAQLDPSAGRLVFDVGDA